MKADHVETKARASPSAVRFKELESLCRTYFGEPRQTSGSHVIFATPWQGDPRVNIQDKNGMAKPYQVRQVIAAIDRLKEQNSEPV
ncbi:toxin HicA [Tersicoccus phoenicis]|uniref:Toxin HicA n=1 Tax=Tersicoccus phoenicis TaxID=554083 RepID=A0A1R1LB77_9MICC|nr:toxin HicA [Tersicoccus phoenicis]OMH24800.1 toxin HicA [Tersicoccus phoenicis]